jgi:alkylated DNA nucleotide flippase Atl1
MSAVTRRPAVAGRRERPAPVSTRDAQAAAILAVVRSIPRGRVTTYGAVAARAGLPRRARLVGKVLSGLPDGSRVPWHRVIAAGGRIPSRKDRHRAIARRHGCRRRASMPREAGSTCSATAGAIPETISTAGSGDGSPVNETCRRFLCVRRPYHRGVNKGVIGG